MNHNINIGGTKGCCFVKISKKLLDRLSKFAFLHEAVEESVVSASFGYYAVGVITFYQLLEQVVNNSSKKDAKIREIPAHQILFRRLEENEYNGLVGRFKTECEKQYIKEITKIGDADQYITDIMKKWREIYNINS